MSEEEKKPYTIGDIKKLFLEKKLGAEIHKELVKNLNEKEQIFLKEQTQQLIDKNMPFGGSPIGFFYKGKLFAVSPTFKKEGITVLDSSLDHEAEMLLLNRTDVPQYTSYIAHFLSYMGNHIEDPTTYVANLPRGLSKFSPTLRTLESYVETHDPEGLSSEKFSRSDSTKETFFLHFDRVDGPLNRFLFRRITR